MNGYSATIVNASSGLTARQKIMLKDFANAINLDEVAGTLDSQFVICPVGYAEIRVENSHSKGDKSYTKYVLWDEGFNKFVTGSPSFMEAFTDIFNDMQDEAEPWAIGVYKVPSKNYKGKDFLTCSLLPDVPTFNTASAEDTDSEE